VPLPASLTWTEAQTVTWDDVIVYTWADLAATTSLAGKSAEIRYDVRGLATQSRVIRYDVRGLATKNGVIRYDVISIAVLAGKTAQIRYDVRSMASRAALIIYEVRGVDIEEIELPDSIPYRLDTEKLIEQAMLNGLFGQIEYRYRLYRSDKFSERIEELPTVESASFSLDNLRDHTWELTLPMDAADELDVWGDYVRLEVEMRTVAGTGGGEYSITRPFGLYFFDEIGGADSPERRMWDLGGKSPEAILMGSTAESGFSIFAGEGILAKVRGILLAQGIPASMIVTPPASQDVAMATTTYFDPFNNATDTRWLRICNTILAAGGFIALFADNEGRLTTRKINASNRLEADFSYGTTKESDNLITSETIEYVCDDETFANRVVVYSGDPAEAASFGVAENHDPNSRISFERLGRWVQKDAIELPSLVSPTEAQQVALQALRVASGMNLRLNFDTIFDTRVKPRQVYGLEVFGDDGDPIWTGDVWPALTISASLDLGPMHHEIQIGVSL